MADITVSTDIDTLLQSADNAAARASIGADVRTDANGAFSAGDLGGNARGSNAINIQASRSAVTQVASGSNSVAVGNRTVASSDSSTAVGQRSNSLGDYSTASGYGSSASAYGSTASGYESDASGEVSTAVGSYTAASGIASTAVGSNASAIGADSSALGRLTSASGSKSTAVGYYAKTAVNNTTEIGYWSNSTTRAGAIRVHSTGQVGLTTPTTDTAYLPSILAKGSEINGTLAQSMFATRIGSTDNELITEVNRAGTIATFSAPRIDSNGAVSIGDLGGNARGDDSINIRTSGSATQVASGPNALAIGNQTTASGNYASMALGYYATASGNYSAASGHYATASGSYSTAVGYFASASGLYGATTLGSNATASGTRSTASGYSSVTSGDASTASGCYSSASGDYSTAVGTYAKTTVNNTTEIGYWSNSTTRAGAIRVHGTGMVAQTIQNRSTAYGDGGATKGSEADNTVIREGIALRRNGNEILVDLNIGGTVTTLSLGTAS